jgi:pyridoxine 5-phosphate synthase
MSTRLSVNINKIALLRNARLGNYPDLYQFAKDCELFGAEGITVHPRPDQRHIRYADIPILKGLVTTEFNMEGNPTDDFINLVLENKPDQCTLVPDSPDALTSDSGWNTTKHIHFLTDIVSRLKDNGIRVSLFLDPDPDMVEGAAKAGADRIELYTGDYAAGYAHNRDEAIAMHIKTAEAASEMGLGINAGHDLNLDNLQFYKHSIPDLLEVSIGHAITCDALYYGIQNTIKMYLLALK